MRNISIFSSYNHLYIYILSPSKKFIFPTHMFAAERLPNEVLRQIMSLLPRESLHSCLTVCSVWRHVSTNLFYNDFLLNESDLHIQPSELSFINWGKRCQLKEYGKLVKNIKLHTDINSPINPTQAFGFLIPYLPNLKVIDLSSTEFWKDYLDLLKVQERTELQRLEQIKLFSTETIEIDIDLTDLMKSYFTTCYRFRHSLTYLELYEMSIPLELENQTGTCLQFLPHFEKLTKLLAYENHIPVAGPVTFKDTDSVIDFILTLEPDLRIITL